MNHVTLRETAEKAARIGGAILLEWADKFTAREKSPANLVTEADFASEKAIFEFIHGKYSDHRFLGEEGLNRNEGDSPYRWIIDPLDGTSNYVHGFPYYAVSIGVEEDGVMVAGAVYDPSRDEMFSAAAGEGTTLNDRPVRVSSQKNLSEALCMASLPVKTTREHPAVQTFLRVLEAAQHVQRTGSAALNLASVAAGRVEAFWSASLMPWDMAAGVLLVHEAGGRVTKTSGDVFAVDEPDLLVSNGSPLHDELIRILG
ncbi:MAG: inositol monophosphatase [Planctomycetaceae bacterium]|nr:inositol monophosphatase [Planctomycetaceae bacterium]